MAHRKTQQKEPRVLRLLPTLYAIQGMNDITPGDAMKRHGAFYTPVAFGADAHPGKRREKGLFRMSFYPGEVQLALKLAKSYGEPLKSDLDRIPSGIANINKKLVRNRKVAIVLVDPETEDGQETMKAIIRTWTSFNMIAFPVFFQPVRLKNDRKSYMDTNKIAAVCLAFDIEALYDPKYTHLII